jgi:hypothetical protein
MMLQACRYEAPATDTTKPGNNLILGCRPFEWFIVALVLLGVPMTFIFWVIITGFANS